MALKSISSYDVRSKLKLSFYLMLVLPLLVCAYLATNYIIPVIGLRAYITILVCLNIFIAMSGFSILKSAVDHMLSEYDAMSRRLEKLEINDSVTGLYTADFIRVRLQEEIRRAIIYQRPCSFMLLRIDDLDAFRKTSGSSQADALLKKCASLIKRSVSEIEPVGRMQDNIFAVLSPEKNKLYAQKIARSIKHSLEEALNKGPLNHKPFVISVGVSENPLDGVNASELIQKAQDALRQ